MEKQAAIETASFRVLHSSPGHVTYGVWVNGGKCGELVVRVSEHVAFEQRMKIAGFRENAGASRPDQIW